MFEQKDIRIDSYCNAVPGAVYNLTVTHIPTGTFAKASNKSYFRARKEAMAELTRMMNESDEGQHSKI